MSDNAIRGSGSRPRLDLSVYLVTDTVLCSGPHGVVRTATQAASGGVSVVQVRDPAADDDTFLTLARAVVAALRGTGVPVILNDRVHLVQAAGADGAHIGQRDLAAEQARAVLGPDAILGLSIDHPAQVEAARALPAGTVDYLGIGPVWAQQTKLDAAAPLGVDGAADIARRAGLPSVAIGGIDAQRARSLRGKGIDGVAVVSAICGQADPALAAAAIRRAWDDERTRSHHEHTATIS